MTRCPSGSTCWRSSGWSRRSSAARASRCGCSPTASARTPRGRARPGQHLAARFCAKEAVAKALRLEAWSPQDIEVVGEGARHARSRCTAALAALGVEVDISLTHSKVTAGAVALVR